MNTGCPFCNCSVDPARHLVPSNEIALVLLDAFPVSPGHTLVIPRKHVESLFELTSAEQSQIWGLVADARQYLSEKYHPDGFNIGLNEGSAAGQTISHAHLHIIPRYKGDVADPRGGVRWLIPEKAAYWIK